MSVGYSSEIRSAIPLKQGEDIVRHSYENKRLALLIKCQYSVLLIGIKEKYMLLGKRSKDITNQRFGSLIAVAPHHKDTRKTLYWSFVCDCGKQHIARGNTIVYEAKQGAPNIPSCGCVELANKTKHGFRKAKDTHPAYRAYTGIMNRCYNNTMPEYKWYGAVGVTICDVWKGNPEAFVKWSINNGWKSGLHIDKDVLCVEQRIHPHVYAPHTCQWTTAKVNVGFATNRDNYGKHPNIRLSHKEVDEILYKFTSGEELNVSQLARDYEVHPSSMYKLINKALSKE